MNIEHFHFKIVDEEMVPSIREHATHTKFIFTDFLEDRSEYGLAVKVKKVLDEPSSSMLEHAEKALAEYLQENGP